MLKKDGAPEYHLAHEAFNAHESEIENGEEFQDYSIPEVARYTGSVDYYNHLWVRADQIELPNDIEYYLELVDNLNPETKEDFRRSTYWFNVGSRFYGEEELSVIPFTIAIECLAPDMPNEPCPTCKKST